MSSRYHGSMVTIPFALSKNGRKLWATVLFLSAITHRKVIHFNFFSAVFAGPRFVDIQKYCYHAKC